MVGFYPDKPSTASDGEEFAALCVSLHWTFFREQIDVFKDKARQYTIGESQQGIEFKELKRSSKKLHIEFEERTSIHGAWHASGLMRLNDNTVRYECGNFEDIFAFLPSDLLLWQHTNKPKKVWYGDKSGLTESRHPMATIGSFVLPKSAALTFCLYRFQRIHGKWIVTNTRPEWMIPHVKNALGPLADTPLGTAELLRIRAVIHPMIGDSA